MTPATWTEVEEEEEGTSFEKVFLLILTFCSPSPQQVEAATCPSSLYELCVEFTLFFLGGGGAHLRQFNLRIFLNLAKVTLPAL